MNSDQSDPQDPHPPHMSDRRPIEIAGELQAAFTNRDAAKLVSLFASKGSVHVAGNPDIAAVGVHRGHEEIRLFFDDLITTVTPLKMEVRDLVTSGTNVVALGHFHYRLMDSEREYESDFALHIDVKHGRIERYQMYEDSWAVAQAFVPEPDDVVRGPHGNRIDYLDLDCRTSTSNDTDPIILLHGIGCTWRIWSRQITALATTRRVIGVNLRGSGLSDPGPTGMRITDLAADLNALLKQLRIPTATVMGLSMGGMVAMQHALDFPDDVSQLLVVGSMAGLPDDLRSVAAGQRQFINNHSMNEIAESRMVAAFGPQPDTELQRWTVDMIAAMNLVSYRAQAAAAFEFGILDRLPEIQAPTHILHGENDLSLPIGLGQAIHQGIAHSTFHPFEDAGHFPNLEQPELFNEVLQTILTGAISQE